MAVEPLVEPFHEKWREGLREPAFQAGCREFESRLPLLLQNRCSQKASQADARKASCDDR